MATETTTRTTIAALILATFALVGIMTTGAVVPAAFAQSLTGPGIPILDQVLAEDGQTGSNGGSDRASDGPSIADGPETTRETTTQTEDQSEQNTQTNAINTEQTANNNAQTGSGEGSEVASAANSEPEAISSLTAAV